MGDVIKPLPLEGAAEIQLKTFQDHRGWFSRWFCQDTLSELNHGRPIEQINSSMTVKQGAVRGLHFQFAPKMEDKIVRCIQGKVFDVIVDLRHDSPTKGKWCSLELDSDKQNMIYIPKGFAHGFQTLTENCQLLYLHTEYHSPEDEGGFHFQSPSLDIKWPLEVTEISERDKNLPMLEPDFKGIDRKA